MLFSRGNGGSGIGCWLLPYCVLLHMLAEAEERRGEVTDESAGGPWL
jgi:hypothetical protein